MLTSESVVAPESLPSDSSMDYRSFSPLLLIVSCLFSAATARATTSLSTAEKVPLALYYETLCPYCSNFIVNHLIKLFNNGDDLGAIVDLKLLPYGNAKIGPNNTIACQHGPAECLLNTVEACAIDVWPDLNEHFSFIYCVETLVYEHQYPQWETCFEKLGLDPKPVSNCYTSGYGKELELKYAAETNALQPPHKYVPWVVVDGQPLYEDYENFISYICKAYNGTSIPSACNEISLNTIVKEKANPAGPVCYKEETTMARLLSLIGSSIKVWMQSTNSAAAAALYIRY